jgi:hypothetical protein
LEFRKIELYLISINKIINLKHKTMTEINPVPTPTPVPPSKTKLPIKTILISLALIAFGIFEYFRFAKMEDSGGSIMVTRYEKLIYESGAGKMGILIAAIIIAVGLIVYHYWKNRKK